MPTPNIPYTLKLSKRARRMRLAVYGDGRCVVTAPHFVRERSIERFVNEKSRWILDTMQYFASRPPVLRVPYIKTTKRDYTRHKHLALLLAQKKVAEWNAFYGFRVGRISVKNQKTRWGSCSKKGNLNFNYKILFLPEPLADYLVVHELCHLGEFNHSRRFWNLVAQTMPDYKARHLALRKVTFRRAILKRARVG